MRPIADLITLGENPPGAPPHRIDAEPRELTGDLLLRRRSAMIAEAKDKLAAQKRGETWRPDPKNGPTSVRYVLDAMGRMYWVDNVGKPTESQQLYLGREDSPEGLHPVLETGRLAYDVEGKRWVMEPDWSSGMTPEDIELARRRIQELEAADPEARQDNSPERRAKAEFEDENQKEKILKCAEIMEKQLSASSLPTRLGLDIASSLVVGGAKQYLKSADYIGSPLDDAEKHAQVVHDRQVLIADTVGNMASSVVMSSLDGYLKKNPIARKSKQIIGPNSKEFVVRAGTRYLIGVQGQRAANHFIIDRRTVPPRSTESAPPGQMDMTTFNNWWFAGRVATDPFISKFIANDLPGYAYNACKSGSLLRIVLSPGVARIIERTATTTLYFGLRGHFTGN